MLRTVQRCVQCSAGRSETLGAVYLVKRFESCLHWQCFVERCAVPPLAATLGFSCDGLGSERGNKNLHDPCTHKPMNFSLLQAEVKRSLPRKVMP